MFPLSDPRGAMNFNGAGEGNIFPQQIKLSNFASLNIVNQSAMAGALTLGMKTICTCIEGDLSLLLEAMT